MRPVVINVICNGSKCVHVLKCRLGLNCINIYLIVYPILGRGNSVVTQCFILNGMLWHIYQTIGYCTWPYCNFDNISIECSALMHIHSPSYCHWLVQWHPNEWGLPSMTTVVFSFSPMPSAPELHVRETTWQHVAQYGRPWYGTGRHSGVCAYCLAHSVVESCPLLHMHACARPLANFITHMHTYSRDTGN